MFEITYLHPVVVHFPIALIVVGFVADISSLLYKKESCLSAMGLYLEVTGMLGAVVAVGTGLFMTSPMEGEAGALREQHELFALLTLGTIVAATVFRLLLVYLKKDQTRLKYVALMLFFLAFIFVSITGHLGGTLVFEYLVGI